MDGPVLALPSTKKSNTWLWLIILAFVLLFIYNIYNMFYLFNDQDVKDYIKEEVNRLPADQQAFATTIIKEGVEDILKSRDRSKQVVAVSSLNKTPREMELVHAAVMQAKALGYLKY